MCVCACVRVLCVCVCAHVCGVWCVACVCVIVPVTVLAGQSLMLPSPGHHFAAGHGAASHLELDVEPGGLNGLPGFTLTQLLHSFWPSSSLKVSAGHTVV